MAEKKKRNKIEYVVLDDMHTDGRVFTNEKELKEFLEHRISIGEDLLQFDIFKVEVHLQAVANIEFEEKSNGC